MKFYKYTIRHACIHLCHRYQMRMGGHSYIQRNQSMKNTDWNCSYKKMAGKVGRRDFLYFVSKVTICNVNWARATAFIFDTRTVVLVKVPKFLRQKISRPEGDSNPQRSDSCRMLYPLNTGQKLVGLAGILLIFVCNIVKYIFVLSLLKDSSIVVTAWTQTMKQLVNKVVLICIQFSLIFNYAIVIFVYFKGVKHIRFWIIIMVIVFK